MGGAPLTPWTGENRATRPHAQSTMVAPGERQQTPQRGVEQNPPERRGLRPPAPRGSYAPPALPRASALRRRLPLCCPPGRRAAGLCAQAWPPGKGEGRSVSQGGGRRGVVKRPGWVGNPAPDEGGAGLSTLPGRLSTPLSRWGRGSAPSDPARGRFGASCWRVLRTE